MSPARFPGTCVAARPPRLEPRGAAPSASPGLLGCGARVGERAPRRAGLRAPLARSHLAPISGLHDRDPAWAEGSPRAPSGGARPGGPSSSCCFPLRKSSTQDSGGVRWTDSVEERGGPAGHEASRAVTRAGWPWWGDRKVGSTQRAADTQLWAVPRAVPGLGNLGGIESLLWSGSRRGAVLLADQTPQPAFPPPSATVAGGPRSRVGSGGLSSPTRGSLAPLRLRLWLLLGSSRATSSRPLPVHPSVLI